MSTLFSMPRRNAVRLFCCGLLFARAVHALDGEFDASFADGGRELVSVSPDHSDVGSALAVLPDGRILMAGSCSHVESTPAGSETVPSFCATRLREDGSYDSSFGPGGLGYVRFDHFSQWPRFSYFQDMALLRDGRALFVGGVSGDAQLLVAVLAADGTSLDTSIGGGNGYVTFDIGKTSGFSRLRIAGDGKILVAQTVYGVNDNQDFAVVRLLADLSGLDTGFGNHGIASIAFDLGGPGGDDTDVATSLAVQEDGKIVVGGYGFTTAAGAPPHLEIELARLLPSGQRDPSFGSDGDGRLHYAILQESTANDLAVDAQGRIVVGGATQPASAEDSEWFFDRLLSDGSRDPTFNAGQPRVVRVRPNITGPLQALARLLVTDDAIIGVGDVLHDSNSTQRYFGAAKLRPDGVLDTTFANQGHLFGSYESSGNYDDLTHAVALTSRGLLIGGGAQVTNPDGSGGDAFFGIARLIYDHIFSDTFE